MCEMATPMSSAQAIVTALRVLSAFDNIIDKEGFKAKAKSIPEKGHPCKTPLSTPNSEESEEPHLVLAARFLCNDLTPFMKPSTSFILSNTIQSHSWLSDGNAENINDGNR